MKKVAFLTTDDLSRFKVYDDLLVEPLMKFNWKVEEVPWRKTDIDWNKFDAVIVRSTWDYQHDPDKFLSVLETINHSSAHLENNLSIMKWNMNKNYLADLQQKGILIVDTIWEKNYDHNNIPGYFKTLKTNEIIIKPSVSASAENTFRINKKNFEQLLPTISDIFNSRSYLVQPFLKDIINEGEYSLFYFGGNYSHTILKIPKEKDFRVQEEHGGTLKLVTPDKNIISTAENVMNKLNPVPLYARVDLVRTPSNDFALMELELIEPSLYFNMDTGSAERFAKIFNEWI